MSISRDYSGISGLKLIAFDLDGTIWSPEMYQLWGGGAPFKPAENGQDLIDSKGCNVRLLGISSELLHDIKHHVDLSHIKVAWVSCCDEPEWAHECLELFESHPSRLPIGKIAHSSQIYSANKQVHFKTLHEEFPDIEFHEMLFFDNEMRNIHNVEKLGVKCVYCPDGMTESIWEDGLKLFRS